MSSSYRQGMYSAPATDIIALALPFLLLSPSKLPFAYCVSYSRPKLHILKKKLIKLKSWVKPTWKEIFCCRKDVWQARCPGRHVWRACRRRLQVPNERLAAENQHLEQLKTCQIIPPSVNFSVGQGVTTCRPASLQTKICKISALKCIFRFFEIKCWLADLIPTEARIPLSDASKPPGFFKIWSWPLRSMHCMWQVVRPWYVSKGLSSKSMKEAKVKPYHRVMSQDSSFSVTSVCLRPNSQQNMFPELLKAGLTFQLFRSHIPKFYEITKSGTDGCLYYGFATCGNKVFQTIKPPDSNFANLFIVASFYGI